MLSAIKNQQKRPFSYDEPPSKRISLTYPIDRSSSFPIDDLNEFLKLSATRFNKNWKNPKSSPINVHSFRLIQTLGKGSYGRVVLGQLHSTHEMYAVKVISKAVIAKSNLVRNVLNEKRITMNIRFPFVTHCEFFFQDNSYLYIVERFLPGGELYRHLKKVGRFTEHEAKFISAQLALALEYLHALKLIHRDIKPENVVFDVNGFLKLIDFGFCKYVTTRTYTICGSPEYVAPEILSNKGYGKSVDWWSFGVIVYELCFGKTPFYHRDEMEMFYAIAGGKYKVIHWFSEDLKELVQNLLVVDVTKRFGCLKRGSDDIKNHKWYNDINWHYLLNRRYILPFIPYTKTSSDTRNFDTSDYEEPLVIASSNKFGTLFNDF